MNEEIWKGWDTFNWKELDGKDVRVFVHDFEGVQVSMLFDVDGNEFYVVNVKAVEVTK